MNNIFDALEVCLQEIENGADMETVIARFPNFAVELRLILETSLKAKSMSAAEPSPEAIRRGRARVMQRAAEMRESKAAPRKRVIPAFQRLALSFSLAAMLLLSGTGLLNASASALPGENLYPVKRTWEGLRLLLIFDPQARTYLEDQFEYERLEEVNELLVEGRDEIIQFAGVFMRVNGVSYVSGIPVVLSADLQLPENGAAVILTGQTNSQGMVEVISFELLPDGTVVPVGKPVEIESESETDPVQNGGDESNGDGQKITEPPNFYALEGTLESVSATVLVVNNLTIYPDNPKIEGQLCIGAQVEVEGYFAEDGRFLATKVEVKGSCSSETNDSGNSNSNTNSSGGSESNGNTNGDDHGGNNNLNGNESGSGNENGSGGDDNGDGGSSGGSGGGGDDDE